MAGYGWGTSHASILAVPGLNDVEAKVASVAAASSMRISSPGFAARSASHTSRSSTAHTRFPVTRPASASRATSFASRRPRMNVAPAIIRTAASTAKARRTSRTYRPRRMGPGHRAL